jgi:hypothetical protein
MYQLSFIEDENAVNIEIGYILNLVIVMVFTGGIVAAFQLYADSSSQKSVRAGFADLGSQIARDITNMYLASTQSQGNFSSNVTRYIPLTIGGSGYSICLGSASQNSMASVDIKEDGFFSYTASTTLNSIEFNPNITAGRGDCSQLEYRVYSGSGTLNIRMQKNNSGTRIWIE